MNDLFYDVKLFGYLILALKEVFVFENEDCLTYSKSKIYNYNI